tara:strand:- start:32 stop:496 length:465 start_codon:yes stop_codon:yes gene_type:complete
MKHIQAQVFKLGIEAGLVDKEEIIDWADEILLSNEPYCNAIADLATCGNRPYSEIFTLLGELCEAHLESRIFWHEFKPFLQKKINEEITTPRAVVSLLYFHYRDGMLPREAEDQIMEFELNYDCAYEGYGSLKDMDIEVTTYFNQPADQDGVRQ